MTPGGMRVAFAVLWVLCAATVALTAMLLAMPPASAADPNAFNRLLTPPGSRNPPPAKPSLLMPS